MFRKSISFFLVCVWLIISLISPVFVKAAVNSDTHVRVSEQQHLLKSSHTGQSDFIIDLLTEETEEDVEEDDVDHGSCKTIAWHQQTHLIASAHFVCLLSHNITTHLSSAVPAYIKFHSWKIHLA